jgi:fatty acid desaturase
MYRRSRFLIGFLAAALTFGGLMATFGPEHFHRSMHWHHHFGNCCMYNDDRMNSCDEPERFERQYRFERYRNNEPATAPMPTTKTDSVKNK